LNTDEIADEMRLLAHMGQEEPQARLPELRHSIARFSRNLAEADWRSALQQALAQRLSGAPPGRTGAAR
jgi:hypothetical protein